jgi:NADPH:quinone reductase-like Zn-dependent oxidoreductase
LPEALVLTQYGKRDVLEWRNVPILESGPGQVRIRVRASRVGPTDLKIRPGRVPLARPPNAILGFEAAGVVDALGPSVSGSKEGTKSLAFCPRWAARAKVTYPDIRRERNRLMPDDSVSNSGSSINNGHLLLVLRHTRAQKAPFRFHERCAS